MEINIGEGVDVDAQAMLTGRCCVIGQSGSGKSYLVGVIAEELSRNGLPYLIVDTEGEYGSLKSAFDVIRVGGDDADVPLGVDYGRLLRSSIVNRVPVVFDVSDEVEKERRVDDVLSTLYSLEEKLRSPYLVIIEEADKFCPQILHKGLNRVEEISVRGRKRGIGLIVATQRPANINKNVLAQCSYGFIGKLTTENDLGAVNVLFDDKRELAKLPALKTGEFVSFGLGGNARFSVKERRVRHGGATPLLSGQVRKAVDLGSLIKEIKGTRGSTGVARAARAPTVGEASTRLLIREAVSKEEARAYAARLLRKRFLLFGGAVEAVESVEERYLPAYVAMLRIPTRRRNEFEERYAVVDGHMALLLLDGRVRSGGAAAPRAVRLSAAERRLLASLSGRRTSEVERVARSNGIDEGAAFKALSRFEDAGLVSIYNDRIAVPDRRRALMVKRPDLLPCAVDSAMVMERHGKSDDARAALALAFPSAEVVEVREAYLPFYEITTRMGDRVRVFRIDALFGKELGPGLV